MRKRASAVLVAGLVLVMGVRLMTDASMSTAQSPLVAPGTVSGGLTVVNRDLARYTTIVTTLYHQRGNPPIPFTSAGVAAGGSANLRLGLGELPTGAYGGISTSDRAVASIARFTWNASGGYAVANNPEAATFVVVPLIVKGYRGETSLVMIQNTDIDQPQTVELELMPVGATEPLRVVTQTIRAGTSVTVDLGRDPRFSNLLNGTVGSMWLRAAEMVSVLSLVDVETSAKAVYAFEGFAVEFAAKPLFAPLVQTGSHNTWIAVANPDVALAADVTVTYCGTGGSCAGQQIVHGGKSYRVPPHSSAVFDLGPGGSDWPTGPSGLPPGCIATATITTAAGPPVMGVVVDRVSNTDRSTQLAGAYDLFRDRDVGRTIALPQVYRRVGPNALTTSIIAMNVGQQSAGVTIQFFGRQGEEIAGCCTAAIPPGASWMWSPEGTPDFPEGAIGSARLTSDQPLAVIARDESLNGTGDMAMHAGVSLVGSPPPPTPPTATPTLATPPTPRATTTPWSADSPLILFNGPLRLPPAPTAPPPPGEQWRIWLPVAQK